MSDLPVGKRSEPQCAENRSSTGLAGTSLDREVTSRSVRSAGRGAVMVLVV